jgi:maleate isomerase
MRAANAALPRAIGVILPSSNRVVERVTRAFLGQFPDIDACFCRVPYAGHPPDGYDLAPFRQAVAMLAQARPDVIVWNATRGALLGFEPDRRLCAMIRSETAIPCTTTALATIDLLRHRGFSRMGIIAQGDAAEGERLKARFAAEGISIVAGRDLGITDNLAAAAVTADRLENLAGELVQQADLDAVLVWSTNLSGNDLIASASARIPVPILDSAAIGLQGALSLMSSEHKNPERSGRAGDGGAAPRPMPD